MPAAARRERSAPYTDRQRQRHGVIPCQGGRVMQGFYTFSSSALHFLGRSDLAVSLPQLGFLLLLMGDLKISRVAGYTP